MTSADDVAPMTNAELAAVKKAALAAAPSGFWYTVDQPWLPAGSETYIIGGHHDPHVGRMVCDFQEASFAGVEDEYTDEEWTARNWANADHIAASNPIAVLSLIARAEAAEAESARLREALKPFAAAGSMMDLVRIEDERVVYTPVINANFCITAGDLRKARAALNP